MTKVTLLDQSVAALTSTPQAEHLQRQFYDRLSGSDLYLLLEAEAKDDQVTPKLMDMDGQSVVLVFDRVDRLAEFAKGQAPFACLPGKDLCALLAANNLGMMLNPETSEHPHLLLAEDVAWVAENLAGMAQTVAAKVTGLRAPQPQTDPLWSAIQTRLSAFEGAAKRAVLAAASYEDGTEGVLVGFIDAREERQAELAATVQDAVALIMPAGQVDVGFFAEGEHIAGALLRNGVMFDLPQTPTYAPTAPGMDPDKPPKL